MISRLGNGLPAKLSSGPRTGYDMAKTGTMLGRGENERELLPAAPWSQTWPAPSATLDLDFVNDRGFVRGVGQGSSMDAVTFSRASNATWVGPDGLLRTHTLGRNLLSYPQNFDIGWGATTVGTSNLLQSKNQEDPLGGFTATAVNETNSTGQFFLAVGDQFSFTNNEILTRSIYVKYNGRRYISLGHAADTGARSFVHVLFDLIDNTVVQTLVGANATLYSHNVDDVGNGWMRLSVTTSKTLVSNQFHLVFHQTSTMQFASNGRYQIPSYVGDGSGILVWGAQLETGSVATEYFPTNINTPRFDWGSTATTSNTVRKNLLEYTDKLLGAGSQGLIVNRDFQQGPFLENSAVLCIAEPTLNVHVFYLGMAFEPNQQYTLSVYFKGVGISKVTSGLFLAPAGWNASSAIDLASGSISPMGSPFTNVTLTPAANGYYRYSFTFTPTFTSAAFQVYVTDNSYTGNWIGDGVSGVYVSSIQLEKGLLSAYETEGGTATLTPLLPTTSSNGLLIEEQRTNLVLWNRDATKTYTPPSNFFAQSENFTSAVGVWNFDGNHTVVGRITGSIDPLGGTTATLIRPTVGRTAGNAYIGQRAGTSAPSTFSVYMSSSGYDFGVLSSFSYTAGNFAVFNLASGSIATASSAAGLSSSMEDVGNGWYRCSLTVNNTTLNRGFLISASPNGTITATANGTGSIAIWGAQANNGVTASAYVSSSTLPTPLWIADNVTVAKDQVGIDGVSNAASSVSASANNATIIYRATTPSQANTCSVYLKRISGTGVVQVTLDGVTWSTVDITSTEWRRVALTGTVTNPCMGIRLATAGDVVAMDYSQVEVGGFVTTPILTTTATVTRNVDLARISGNMFVDWFNLSNGVLFAEASKNEIGRNGIPIVEFFGSTRQYGILTNAGQIYGGAPAVIGNVGTFGLYEPFSAALRHQRQNYAIFGKGVLGKNFSSEWGSPVTGLVIGNINANSVPLTGYIKKIKYFNFVTTDDGLQNLTL